MNCESLNNLVFEEARRRRLTAEKFMYRRANMLLPAAAITS